MQKQGYYFSNNKMKITNIQVDCKTTFCYQINDVLIVDTALHYT